MLLRAEGKDDMGQGPMAWEEALALHLIPCPGPQRNSELQEQSHLGATRLSPCLPIYTIQ